MMTEGTLASHELKTLTGVHAGNVPKYVKRKVIWNTIAEDLFADYVEKNKDYGDSFNDGVNLIGPLFFVSRAYDKVTRMISLCKQPDKVRSESFDDSVRDMVTYGMMYLLKGREELID